MATVKTDERNYMNIANAIRAKTGSQETFTPGEMDEAILSIPAGSGGSGLTEEVKQALLDCFENVAWINDQGQTYYQALYDALYPPANLVSISAVFTQGSVVISETDSLDTLKQYLVVTAHYDDQTTETISDYTLSGTLTVGTSVITVSYGGKTTTFNVIVSRALPSGYTELQYIESTGEQYINTGYLANQNTEIYAKFTQTVNTPNDSTQAYFGYLNGSNPYNRFAFMAGSWGSEKRLYLSRGSAEINSVFTTYQVELNIVSTPTNLCTINGTQYSGLDNDFSASTVLPMFIFARNGATVGRFISARCYGFRIAENGVDIMNLVPCRRNSDSVIGMYDEVSGNFYTNSGTGVFLAGGNA